MRIQNQGPPGPATLGHTTPETGMQGPNIPGTRTQDLILDALYERDDNFLWCLLRIML